MRRFCINKPQYSAPRASAIANPCIFNSNFTLAISTFAIKIHKNFKIHPVKCVTRNTSIAPPRQPLKMKL